MAEPGPHLTMALAMERTGGPNGADFQRQGGIRHRAQWTTPSRRWRGPLMAVDARTGEPPDATTADRLRIPRQSGQGFRFDVGHRSDLIPATIPK